MAKMRGGIEFRAGRPIRLPPPPDAIAGHRLRLRCPERPEVVVGQVVKRGDHLIKPMRDSVACYVSPITGTVRAVKPASGPGGSSPVKGYDVTIEPASPTVPTSLEVPPPRGRKLDAWFSALRQVGPWNDRDGNVGLVPQLEAARNTPPDTLICVGLDAFPPFPDRSSLLMSFPDDAVLGTLVLADLLGVKDVFMLAAQSAPVLGRLRPSCRNYRLKLIAQHNRYPSAEPTLVVSMHASGKRKLPHGSNPVTQGVVLITPWTAVRIGRWYTLRKIELVRPVMMAWPDAGAPLSFKYAMPGQPLFTLDTRLEQYARATVGQLLFGNPMSGRPAVDDGAALRTAEPDDSAAAVESGPVVPEDETVVAALAHLPEPQPTPCISCGWCAQVCPTQLRPIHLMKISASRSDDVELLDHLPWCVHCGLCSHVCPSSIPLAQSLQRAMVEMERAQ